MRGHAAGKRSSRREKVGEWVRRPPSPYLPNRVKGIIAIRAAKEKS
jgi:hypothetical protein